MAKMKTNQDGGSYSAKKPSAPAKELAANQKGAAKGMDHKKGAADYSVGKGSHDHPHGASRMGYKQSFGANKANCYAKGAAKVAEIMTFGASKYMKHGAADAGHGGPEGHDHPSMTITSRNTSGGGSSSSSSNTTGGGSSSSMQSTDNLANYQAGLKDLGPDFKPTAEQTARANARVRELKKKDADAATANAANVTSSSSSSNNTNAGRSTTTSNTTTSPNSMAETLLQANIGNENRAQRFNFDRDEANIKAANDSIRASNRALDRLPRHRQLTPQGQNFAGRAGGRAAAQSRRDSGLFSREEVTNMYRGGQNKQ
jgi:hypothetical protein